MRTLDGDGQTLRQFGAGSDMIQMTMGQQNALGFQLELAQKRLDAIRLTARIDDGRAARACAPEQGAVLLEAGDG